MQRGSWYAWNMFPGYGSQFVPYVCPIMIYDITPEKTGRKTMMMHFFNSGYADGVQDFSLRLRVLARRQHYLVAELLYGPGSATERHAVIGRIGSEWLKRNGFAQQEISNYSDLTQAQVDAFFGSASELRD